MSEPYVPSEALLRAAWSDYCQSMDDCNVWVRPGGIDTRAEFDRFLARVRRDAAREALDGLAEQEASNAERRRFKDDQRGYALCRHAKHAADDYRDTNYSDQEDA